MNNSERNARLRNRSAAAASERKTLRNSSSNDSSLKIIYDPTKNIWGNLLNNNIDPIEFAKLWEEYQASLISDKLDQLNAVKGGKRMIGGNGKNKEYKSKNTMSLIKKRVLYGGIALCAIGVLILGISALSAKDDYNDLAAVQQDVCSINTATTAAATGVRSVVQVASTRMREAVVEYGSLAANKVRETLYLSSETAAKLGKEAADIAANAAKSSIENGFLGLTFASSAANKAAAAAGSATLNTIVEHGPAAAVTSAAIEASTAAINAGAGVAVQMSGEALRVAAHVAGKAAGEAMGICISAQAAAQAAFINVITLRAGTAACGVGALALTGAALTTNNGKTVIEAAARETVEIVGPGLDSQALMKAAQALAVMEAASAEIERIRSNKIELAEKRRQENADTQEEEDELMKREEQAKNIANKILKKQKEGGFRNNTFKNTNKEPISLNSKLLVIGLSPGVAKILAKKLSESNTKANNISNSRTTRRN
jgi:hypothetical protein